MRSKLILVVLFFAGTVCNTTCAQSPASGAAEASLWNELVHRSPWIFVGDSNTYAGGYVAMLETWLKKSNPQIRLLNLGVSSETASGLSEVDHPFKRPCVHERIDKVLRMTSPGVVFACYGMNDGIYDPPNTERLTAYQAGMRALAEKVRASGALFVVLTPPIFEPEPVGAKGKFGPTKDGRYAWFAPYELYDDVLAEQAAWCSKNDFKATAVIDIRSALQADKARRVAQDASFAYSSDGVHFGNEAHEVVTRAIVAGLGAPESVQTQFPSSEELALGIKRMQLLRDAWLSATGKNRPGLPAGQPVWLAEQQAAVLSLVGQK